MIVAIIGRLGTGKTAYLTWIGKHHFEEGRKIYSNYPVAFPHEKITHPFQLLDMEDGVFLADEFYLWVSSVASQRKVQIALSNVYRKFRKKKVDVYATSQRFLNLHVRYRELCDLVFKMRRRPPVGPVRYFEAIPCVVARARYGTPEPLGRGRVRFTLDEVKDLYDTHSDIYASAELEQEAVDLLASVPSSEFFAGKAKEAALDELIMED